MSEPTVDDMSDKIITAFKTNLEDRVKATQKNNIGFEWEESLKAPIKKIVEQLK